jgi:hypothetical protein
LLCQTHTRMHRGEITCFVKPIPECTEEKRLALSNPYQNASRRNNLLCQTHTRMHRKSLLLDAFWYGFDKASRFSSVHSGMGLTKQVVSPRCILVWVWQSKSFLLDAFWYGFNKASCFSSMYSSMGLTKQVVSSRCILVWVWKSKSFLLDAFWYGFDKAGCFSSMHYGMGITKQVVTRRHRGETTCFVKPIPECIEEKQLALLNPY